MKRISDLGIITIAVCELWQGKTSRDYVSLFVTTTKNFSHSCTYCLFAPIYLRKKEKTMYSHWQVRLYISDNQNRLMTYEMKENCLPLLLCVRHYCYAYPAMGAAARLPVCHKKHISTQEYGHEISSQVPQPTCWMKSAGHPACERGWYLSLS